MAHFSWGPGWPNCQPNRIDAGFRVLTHWGWTRFPGGVRRELSELLTRLIKETDNRGYHFGVEGNPSYGCWGYLCRPVAGTHVPSNHSYGLSIDINAPRNPRAKTLHTDMPDWMPDLWNAYGFRWGGDYVKDPDAMHYEFMGSMDDAIRMTQLARKNRLGDDRSDLIPQPKPPTSTNAKDDKVYVLVKGKDQPEIWLTDTLTKRLMKDKAEADFFVYVINGAGGVPVKTDNGNPEVWPQEYVDSIHRSDENLFDATLQWYANEGEESPLHEIVRQVLSTDPTPNQASKSTKAAKKS